MVEARNNGNVAHVTEYNMELSQEAGLRRVKVAHHILIALLLDKLKDGELLGLAQDGIRLRDSVCGVRQVGHAEVEMGTPAQSERHLLEDILLRVVHLDVAYLEVGAGRVLANTIQSARQLTARLHLNGGASRFFQQ